MKIRTLLALSMLMFTVQAIAAVRYTFHQSGRSEVEDIPSASTSGRVVIDADRSRVDFDGRTLWGEKAYIISSTTQKKMFIVDPGKKTVAEVNLENVAQSLASAKLQIANIKTDFQKLPDHIEIAGLPTDHYRLEASYDMTVMFGAMPLTQRVTTVVEKWTTTAFGDVSDAMASNLFHTGNMQLDDLMDAESNKMRGLALRQVTTVTTGDPTNRKGTGQKAIPTRKQVSEMMVDSIQIVPADASLFQVPSGFKRIDHLENGDALQELSLSQ